MSKKIEEIYPYEDEQEKLLYQTVRLIPKDFRARVPDGNGGYKWGLHGTRKVPYRLPEFIQSDYVCIAEGERDVESLREINKVSTCNPFGSGKWLPEFNQYFEGKRVVIFYDNDPPGIAHAQNIAVNLW